MRQVRLCATASVLVGAHGAHLTNIIFMPEGSAVLEVIFRMAVCTCADGSSMGDQQALPASPTEPPPQQIPRKPCRSQCGWGYYKADYANTAAAFGLNWRYHDVVAVSPASCALSTNPIGCKSIIVDPIALADDAAELASLVFRGSGSFGRDWRHRDGQRTVKAAGAGPARAV